MQYSMYNTLATKNDSHKKYEVLIYLTNVLVLKKMNKAVE